MPSKTRQINKTRVVQVTVNSRITIPRDLVNEFSIMPGDQVTVMFMYVDTPVVPQWSNDFQVYPATGSISSEGTR